MKNKIFQLVLFLSKIEFSGISKIHKIITGIIDHCFNFLFYLSSIISRTTLRTIDKDRYDHAVTVIEQAPLNRELSILSSISAVKEDALARGLWTSAHSDSLNAYGNILFNECDWDIDRIYDYIRGVVESIPGLSYAVGSEDDDDEGDDNIELN